MSHCSDERVRVIERIEKGSEDKFQINLLEDNLRNVESKYEELEVNWKSNLERLAVKKVELTVAKEMRAFAESMLNQKRALMVEEKQKLDDLHWQVWEGERKICADISKCLTDNNSVNFLNEFPRVLKSGKYASCAARESDDEIKKAIEESPEIIELREEIAALETEVKKAEENCWQETLDRVLAELKEFKRLYPENEEDETKRFIEALESSHLERMSLETEITKIECGTATGVHIGSVEKQECQDYEEPDDVPRIKVERKEASNACLSDKKKWLEHTLELKPFNEAVTEVDKKEDKKLKAKKWYENYACELAVSHQENDMKNDYTKVSQRDNVEAAGEEIVVEPSASEEKEPQQKMKKIFESEDRYTVGIEKENGIICFSNSEVRPVPKFIKRYGQSEKSRFFEKDKNKRESGAEISFSSGSLKPRRNLDPGNEPRSTEVDLLQRIPKPKRKFESLMATPSNFLKSTEEATVDKNSVQSSFFNRTGAPSYPLAHGNKETTQKRSGKFTPKEPSKMLKNFRYRQTKLDDFHAFMLSDTDYKL